MESCIAQFYEFFVAFLAQKAKQSSKRYVRFSELKSQQQFFRKVQNLQLKQKDPKD